MISEKGSAIIVETEQDMLKFAKDFAGTLEIPAVLVLIGDVGAGKTTFTRGLAEGLGVKEPVTSPSFTLSKRYAFPSGELVHYDFYRLDDPGIMRDELAETLDSHRSVTVIEWGQDVQDLMPWHALYLVFAIDEDGSRIISQLVPKGPAK